MLQEHPLFVGHLGIAFMSFGSARPFWTLAVEWWIYMFFGYVFLKILNKKAVNRADIAIALLFGIVPAYNLVNGRGNGLFAYWLFGAAVYLATTRNLLKFTAGGLKRSLLLSLLALAGIRLYLTRAEYEPIFAFILSLVFFLLIELSSDMTVNGRVSGLIRFGASYSYTLYLIHYSVFYFLVVHFKNAMNPYLLFAAGWFVSNAFGIMLGRYTEITLTKLLKSYLYSHELKIV
jgi:peptidoglycan/LPS O-acetylase OafA/YrhL